MILEDDNILFEDVKKGIKEELYNTYLGKVYMTKQGTLGYVWNINEDGTPKTIVCPNTNYVKLTSLYLMDEKQFERFRNGTGFYIPTHEQFRKSMSSWNDMKYDILKIMDNMIRRSQDEYKNLSYLYTKKKNICPLKPLGGSYWLKYMERTYYVSKEIHIEVEPKGYITTESTNGLYAENYSDDYDPYDPIGSTKSRQLLFFKDLNENEIQSYEESDKMIKDTIDNLTYGIF